ncbi:MAG: universal stress protein [Rectinema sp.]|jgi:nucleotide-binding universal stress UspA family protein|uniref:Putative universal stress protein family n=1 Tax=uncultured spirochete TaxID=156406 RepID=A0A3P3XMV8_9SPIR|nr:putative universal stress protein family [uncultured spirochete]
MKKILETVLVAINGSDASICAFKYALALKKAFGSRIVACYVVDTATIRQLALSRIFVPEESEEYERNLENSGQRYLNFCTDLARQKQLAIETCVRKGSVSGEIVKYSIELNADAIILGGAPADALYRDAIADSNHEVLKNARCPVLFVKPPLGEEFYKSM